MRGIIAGLVVVALAAVCVVVFMGKGEKQVEKVEKKPTKIKEVKPAPAPTNAVPEKPVDPRENYDHELCYRDKDGILRYKGSLCRAPDPTRRTSKPGNISGREIQVFSNHCERAIASLLSFTPNGRKFRAPDYSDPEFLKSFQEALATPIRISPDDNKWNKALKQAVIDAKKEIAQRMEAGENLADILNETRLEIERLNAYKRDLSGQVEALVKDGEFGTDDVRDLVAAANGMLEKEGLAPIEADEFVTWNLRLTAERKGEDPDAAVEQYEQEQEAKDKEVQNGQGENE